MPTTLSRDWTFQGFDVIRLENDLLQVDILPQLGGKIVHLFHKGIDREFLWSNSRLRLREVPVGAGYDDHFFGGWDELLPNDEAEEIGGEPWADHGELWTTPLCVETTWTRVSLSGTLPINPLFYRREMWLDEEKPLLHMKSIVVNRGRKQIDFLWKLHPALQISPGTEIIVPAQNAIPVDADFSRFGHLSEFAWPSATDKDGNPVWADKVPELDGSTEFLYLTQLQEGKCALANKEEDWRFSLSFPREVFPTVWVFASFGGWRDHEVLILEPCTTWPKNLSEAIPAGRACSLEPGESIAAEMTVYAGQYEEEE